jgi:hypothetical protein
VMAEATGVVITDPAATAPVLDNFVDDFELDPPVATFDASEEGVLTWDFHSSATPPSIGGGDIATGTTAISTGFTEFEPDLTAEAGQTGYMHMRLTATDDSQVSNILTSQQFTVPSTGPTDGLLLEDGTSFYLQEDGTSYLTQESA